MSSVLLKNFLASTLHRATGVGEKLHGNSTAVEYDPPLQLVEVCSRSLAVDLVLQPAPEEEVWGGQVRTSRWPLFGESFSDHPVVKRGYPLASREVGVVHCLAGTASCVSWCHLERGRLPLGLVFSR